MPVSLDRRQLLAAGGAGIATSFVGTTTQSARAAEQAVPRFGYCLNMSTIRAFDGKGGTPRPIVEQIEIAAKAGYNAIEPWVREVHEYKESGGSMKDLRKRIEDGGLTVESAIGFAPGSWTMLRSEPKATKPPNATWTCCWRLVANDWQLRPLVRRTRRT